MMAGEKGHDMDSSEKTKLAALLIELSLHEGKVDEEIATRDRDFGKLKKIAEIQGAIQIILEYLGN